MLRLTLQECSLFLHYVWFLWNISLSYSTGRSDLNGDKIKHFKSSTIKYTGEIDTFSNTGTHKISYVLSRAQHDHFSVVALGTSRWYLASRQVLNKFFIGKAFCSSDDSVTQLIHMLYIFTINNAPYNTHPHSKRIQRSQIWKMRRPEDGSPFSFPTVRKLLVQKDATTTTGEFMWCSM